MGESRTKTLPERMISIAIKVIVTVVVAYGVLLLLAWHFQIRLAMPGVRDSLGEPRFAALRDGEHIMFDAADGAHLHGWYFPATPTPPTDRAPALIWFHGNGETVHGLEPVFAVLRPPGIALITVDYRGYGLSTGALSEDGLYHDADATWQFASHHPAIDPERIAVYGRSLGASPALYLAEHHPVKAVVLDSPFSSARDMAALHYRLVPRPLIRLSLDNVRRAAQITAPLLIFHGEADRIAPARMTRAVATAGRAEKIVTFPGAGHNDVYVADLDRYRRELHMFLESAVR